MTFERNILSTQHLGLETRDCVRACGMRISRKDGVRERGPKMQMQCLCFTHNTMQRACVCDVCVCAVEDVYFVNEKCLVCYVRRAIVSAACSPSPT